jgi:hypothetical protein
MAKTKACRAGAKRAVAATGKRHTRKSGRAPRRGRKCASRRRRRSSTRRRKRRYGGEGEGETANPSQTSIDISDKNNETDDISDIAHKIEILSKIHDAQHSIYEVLKKMVFGESAIRLDRFNTVLTEHVRTIVNKLARITFLVTHPDNKDFAEVSKLKKELRNTTDVHIQKCGVLIADIFREFKENIETKISVGKMPAEEQKKIITSIDSLTPLIDDTYMAGLIDSATIKDCLDAISKLDVITTPPPPPSMFSNFFKSTA